MGALLLPYQHSTSRYLKRVIRNGFLILQNWPYFPRWLYFASKMCYIDLLWFRISNFRCMNNWIKYQNIKLYVVVKKYSALIGPKSAQNPSQIHTGFYRIFTGLFLSNFVQKTLLFLWSHQKLAFLWFCAISRNFYQNRK